MDILINWQGIYSPKDLDKSDFQDIRNKGGVYLWLYAGTTEQVAYVGKANNFEGRLKTHIGCILGGLYNTYTIPEGGDLLPFVRDHVIGKTERDVLAKHPDLYVPIGHEGRKGPFSFQKAFFDDEVSKRNRAYLDRLRFALGVIEEKAHRAIAETSLLLGLGAIYSTAIGIEQKQFLLAGGRANETVLGTITQWPTGEFELLHKGDAVAKLPSEVRAVVGARINTGERTPAIAPGFAMQLS